MGGAVGGVGGLVLMPSFPPSRQHGMHVAAMTTPTFPTPQALRVEMKVGGAPSTQLSQDWNELAHAEFAEYNRHAARAT